LNPEVYGYKVKPNTASNWTLPSQDLTYNACFEIANQYNQLIRLKNKVSGFEMNNMLNLGIPLEDILHYTEVELLKKHNLVELNTRRIDEYKKLIGL
jgi:hypothetical protein